MDIISALGAMEARAVNLSSQGLRLLERAPGGLALLSGHEFDIVYASPAFAQRAAGVGRAFFELFPELKEQGVHALFDRIVAKRRTYTGIGRRVWLKNRGAREWSTINVTLQPVVGGSGLGLGLLVHFEETHGSRAIGRNADTSSLEREQARMADALRDAIDNGGIELHYQPQVDLTTGAICGVEALVRWTETLAGPVSADAIVRIAEEAGLIGQLGERVLRMACAQVQAWRTMGARDLRIAVNLSARQVGMQGLERMVLDVLEETGLPPENLDLELTESVAMSDMERAIACFERLKCHGIKISLDDFGTGHSSLAYLRMFPLDSLKIDRLFLEQVPGNARAAGLVCAIIAVAHGLGMRVVAEGVEHEAQLRFLARNRCDEIQGYYFSRPLPPSQLGDMLACGHALPAELCSPALHTHCVVLVDSDLERRHAVGALVARLLARGGRVVYAGSAEEAAQNFGDQPDLILAGAALPDMSGAAFLRVAGETWPAAARILLTGQALQDDEQVGPDSADSVIAWPAGQQMLMERMRTILL